MSWKTKKVEAPATWLYPQKDQPILVYYFLTPPPPRYLVQLSLPFVITCLLHVFLYHILFVISFAPWLFGHWSHFQAAISLLTPEEVLIIYVFDNASQVSESFWFLCFIMGTVWLQKDLIAGESDSSMKFVLKEFLKELSVPVPGDVPVEQIPQIPLGGLERFSPSVCDLGTLKKGNEGNVLFSFIF